MTGVTTRLRSALEAAVQALETARRRRQDARAQAICPVDSWAFTPLYTDGACPLCGWAPDGYEYSAPLLTPYDRYWGAIAAIAAVSVIMCIAVAVALAKG